MTILWWLAALIILFIFFGGISSLVLACIAYSIKKDSWLVFILGFLLSGGVSYWSCRHAMKGVKLSFCDTAVAVIISLATFIVATLLLPAFFANAFPSKLFPEDTIFPANKMNG